MKKVLFTIGILAWAVGHTAATGERVDPKKLEDMKKIRELKSLFPKYLNKTGENLKISEIGLGHVVHQEEIKPCKEGCILPNNGDLYTRSEFLATLPNKRASIRTKGSLKASENTFVKRTVKGKTRLSVR